LQGSQFRRRWREFLLGEDLKESAIAQHEGIIGEATFREATTIHRSRAKGRGRGRPRKSLGGGITS
jgi:hypothetical protein